MPQLNALIGLIKAVQLGAHSYYGNTIRCSYLPHRYYFLTSYITENELEEWIEFDTSGFLSINYTEVEHEMSNFCIDLDIIRLALKLNAKRNSTGVCIKLSSDKERIDKIIHLLEENNIKNEFVTRTKTLRITDPVDLFLKDSIELGIYSIATIYEMLTQSEIERLLYYFLQETTRGVIKT